MKKRIMICSLPGDYSGVPIYSKTLANNLYKKADFFIYTSANHGIYDGCKSQVIIEPLLRNSLNPLHIVINSFLFIKTLKKLKPDLIHLNGTMFGLIGRLISIFSRKEFIFTYHGLPWGEGRNKLLSSIFFLIELFLINFGRSITISISIMDKNRLQRINFFNKKIEYIVNSVELNVSSCPKKFSKFKNNTNLKIINVARFSKQKNFARLFEAFNILPDSFCLTVVGFGTNDEQCINLAKKLCSNKKISNINFIGLSKNISELLSDADIFVLSSDYEGMPLSAIEAMAHGIPLVLPEVGGSHEFESSGAAAIYRPNKPEELAKTINNLFLRPDKLHKMSKAGIDSCNDFFSKNTFIDKMIRIYKI